MRPAFLQRLPLRASLRTQRCFCLDGLWDKPRIGKHKHLHGLNYQSRAPSSSPPRTLTFKPLHAVQLPWQGRELCYSHASQPSPGQDGVGTLGRKRTDVTLICGVALASFKSGQAPLQTGSQSQSQKPAPHLLHPKPGFTSNVALDAGLTNAV